MKRTERFSNAAPNTLFTSTADHDPDFNRVTRLSDTPNIDATPFHVATNARINGVNPHLVEGRVLWHYESWDPGVWSPSCRSKDRIGSEMLMLQVNR